MTPHIVLLAAIARNGVIGANNRLPWHLPADLRRFKRLTLGKPVVMGRKTFQSIGKPLPHRRNIVMSRTPTPYAGCEVTASLEATLHLLRSAPEIAIIGGGEIYAQFLPLAHRLELTHVAADAQGDTVFPALDPSEWLPVAQEDHPPDAHNAIALRFATLQRRRPTADERQANG